jgi:uncharacterized protein YbjT (DUF2867 family)
LTRVIDLRGGPGYTIAEMNFLSVLFLSAALGAPAYAQFRGVAPLPPLRPRLQSVRTQPLGPAAVRPAAPERQAPAPRKGSLGKPLRGSFKPLFDRVAAAEAGFPVPVDVRQAAGELEGGPVPGWDAGLHR